MREKILAVLALLLGVVVAGCGSSSEAPNRVGNNTATIQVNHILSRAVPASIDSFRFTGRDGNGSVLYGPETRPRAGTTILSGVSVSVVELEIEYLSNNTVVGRFVTPVTLVLGGTFVINDPAWVDVSAFGDPVGLQFLAQPQNSTPGGLLNVSVAVVDANGVLVENSSLPVTLALQGVNGGLGGTLTVNAVNGIAVFSDLRVLISGDSFILVASSPGLASATSAPFAINSDLFDLSLRSLSVPLGLASGGDAGDFNNDSRTDFVAGDTLSERVWIAFQQAEGGFTSTSFSAPNLRLVRVGQFTGDQNLDLAVVLGVTPFQVQLHAGNGDGTFQAPTTTDLPATVTVVSDIAIADLNSDNRSDVVLSTTDSTDGPVIQGLLSNGTSFSSPQQSIVTGTLDELAAGNLVGNSFPDVAVISGASTVSILTGNGDATFTEVVAPLTTTFLASTLAVANFDAAGGVDIAVAGLETVNFQFQMSVFTNQSDVFTLENDYFLEPASGSSAESLAAGDFNEDGVPDLAGVVTINNRDYTHIWLAQPNTGGTLLSTPSRVHSGGTTDDLAVADLNNDGHLDAAITFNGGYFGRLNGAGDGTLQVLPNGATDFAAAVAGDVNGDGREDLVAYVQDLTSPDPVQDTDRFDVYLRNVDGTLPSSPNFTFDATSTTQQLALADMDGDQTLDLVVGTRSSRVDIHTNPGGNGNFSTSPTEINVPGFRVFEIAFVNGDTFPDIVTNDNGTIPPGMTVALSNSVLNYSTSEIPTTNAVSDLRFAFFDDDANIDIVTAQGNEGVGVLLGDGTGSFTENLFDVNGGSHVETLDVGLLNADASLDVVTSGNDTFRLFGNGSGGLGTASMLTGPSFDDPTQTWIVDADLDGILDVLVTEGTAYGVTAYRGTGSGNFEPADNSFFHLGGEPVGARNGFLFDSDGDGVREPNFAVSVDASGTLVSVLVLLLLIGLRVWVYRRRVGLPA